MDYQQAMPGPARFKSCPWRAGSTTPAGWNQL